MIEDGPELNEIRVHVSDDSDSEPHAPKRKAKRGLIISDDSDLEPHAPKRTAKGGLILQKKNYKQKYVESWEKEFKGWLDKKDGKAFCKFCHLKLGSKKSTLQDHAKSKKHRENCQISDERMKQTNLDFSAQKGEKFHRLKAEAWAAMFVATHTSIKSADHLTEGCSGILKDSRSKIAALLMHRTKCTAVIRKVLAPHFRKKLVRDIGDMPFSLIIDETTDIQTKKILGIVVRYIDLILRKVVSTFLDMIEITDGCAETIAKNVDDLLKKIGLKSDNCIGVFENISLTFPCNAHKS